MATKNKGTLKVFNTHTGQRDTEHDIVYVTEDGMFTVVKFDKEYPTFHTNTGKLIPGNVESSRTQKNAKQFANNIAEQQWFTDEGKIVHTAKPVEIRQWVTKWKPEN